MQQPRVTVNQSLPTNHKKKKKRDTGTEHAGDEEEEGSGSIFSGNQDPSALIPTANYCLLLLMGV